MKKLSVILSLSSFIFLSNSIVSYADENLTENINSINSNIEINMEEKDNDIVDKFNDSDNTNLGTSEEIISNNNMDDFDKKISSDDLEISNSKEFSNQKSQNNINNSRESSYNKKESLNTNNIKEKLKNDEVNFNFYKIGDNVYCKNLENNKHVSTGWIQHKGKKYFCKKDGLLYTNQIITFGPKVAYYMGNDGAVVKSVISDNGVLRHANSKTGILSHIGWIEENNKKYFSKNNLGELYRNQVITFGPKVAYYMGNDGAVVKSVISDNGVLRHANSKTGILSHIGWIEENDKKYFSKNNLGELYRDQVITFGPKVAYYMGKDGSVTKSFFRLNGKLSYADKNTGKLSHVGWIEENGKKYFSKNNLGELYTNQIITFGPKVAYYMGKDGSVTKSFFKANGVLRHADKNTGQLSHVGWIEEDGKKYFSKNNLGELYVNQIITFGPKISYYMGRDGSIDTLSSGWCFKDGQTSYVYPNGKLAKGHVNIDGLKYYFDKKGYLKSKNGIDISIWNKIVNWKDIKNSGIDFVMIRSSGSFASNGKLYKDNNFVSNIRGALAAGLDVGVYHYSQAITNQEAITEANFVDSIIRPYKSRITLPIALDREIYTDSSGYVGRTYNIGREKDTEVSLTFLDHMKKLGYNPSFYSYTSYLNNSVNSSKISRKYPIWVAQYNYKCDYNGQYHMWQYTSKGKIKGIEGNVDLNLMYV